MMILLDMGLSEIRESEFALRAGKEELHIQTKVLRV